MNRQQNPNVEILELAIAQLEELSNELVFLGGCTVGLLITDVAAPPIRVSKDVDAIIQVVSRAEYYKLSERLRDKGFSEDNSEGAPICRWIVNNIILDVMPTDSKILGFGNQWYAAAAKNAELFTLPSKKDIKIVSAPYFLITKLEAFTGRGKGDFFMSHDMEDIVAVLDGRHETLDEIKNSEPMLQAALANRFGNMLKDRKFLDSISGHMPTDNTSQQRVQKIITTINKIIG